MYYMLFKILFYDYHKYIFETIIILLGWYENVMKCDRLKINLLKQVKIINARKLSVDN